MERQKEELVYSTQRVHRVVGILLAIICPILTIQGYLRLGVEVFLYGVVALVVLAGFIYYMNQPKGSDNVKKYTVVTLLTVILVGLFLMNGYSLQYHYLIFMIMGIGALYFDEKLMKYIVAMIIVIFAVLYVGRPEALVGTSGVTSVGIIFGSVLAVWVTLYLLTKWVGKLVAQVVEKEAGTAQTLEQLQGLMTHIMHTTGHIDQDVAVCSQSTRQLSASSEHIVQGIGQMSEALQQLGNRMTTIDDKMVDSLESIQETERIVGEVSEYTQANNLEIERSTKEIGEVRQKVDKIEDTITQAQLLMKELDGSIQSVNQLLQAITGIADQTNLLALNANIEAARAGESGRGFAVVAVEIGKLANESSEIVESITKVNREMLSRSQYVGEQVMQSVQDTAEGKERIVALSQYFEVIRGQSTKTNSLILEQVARTQELLGNYTSVQQEMAHITAIAQENTATVEEITAIIQDEDSQIHAIADNIQSIAEQTHQLRENKVYTI